jgi:hypothetical protein
MSIFQGFGALPATLPGAVRGCASRLGPVAPNSLRGSAKRCGGAHVMLRRSRAAGRCRWRRAHWR